MVWEATPLHYHAILDTEVLPCITIHFPDERQCILTINEEGLVSGSNNIFFIRVDPTDPNSKPAFIKIKD